MKKKLIILGLVLACVAGICIPAFACTDACHTKCAAKYPSSLDLYLACMTGCCPEAM